MRRWLVILFLGSGCVPASRGRTSFVDYEPRVAKADPGVLDGELYASAVWALAQAVFVVSDRDPDTFIVTTQYESVGVPDLAVFEATRANEARRRVRRAPVTTTVPTHYHRWRLRAAEGLLFLEIDCGTVVEEIAGFRNATLGCDTPKRAAQWVRMADELAKFILDDARRRADRRRERLHGAGADE